MGHGAHLLPERGTKRSVALSTKVPKLFQSCSGEVAGRVDISHNRQSVTVLECEQMSFSMARLKAVTTQTSVIITGFMFLDRGIPQVEFCVLLYNTSRQ